jgi:alkanesulfonate monooxygenase SsuD/methylene tetrahydromethanopterin reductase-like flavin-dependent oxidoreductase (luciferase family)
VLAKQLATLDSISGGRLTVGLGVGDREEDYVLSGASMRTRFSRIDEMIDELRTIWTSADPQVAMIGPHPPAGRPPLLLGGRTEAALRRVVRYDTGWTMALGTPERFHDSVERIARWRAQAGVEGPVRAIASSHYALGTDAGSRLRSFIVGYFAHLGPYAEVVAGNCPADEEALARTIAGFSAVGADELIFLPTQTGIDQLELLGEVALGAGRGSAST